MGALLWIGKMFAKIALLFVKFDSMGLFDALAMLFGEITEDETAESTDSAVEE